MSAHPRGESALEAAPVLCAFCGKTAVGTCSRPVVVRTVISAAQLKVGDRLDLRWQDEPLRLINRFAVPGKYGCSTEEVTAVFRRRAFTTVWLPPAEFQLRPRSVTVRNPSLLRVDRPFPCGEPCCELHSAERAPGVLLCADHWNMGALAAAGGGR